MKREVHLNVAQKIGSPSALTQEQGDIIFEEISNSILTKTVIHLDFSQIKRIIPSFLNNSIGKLYKDFTSAQIKSYLDIQYFPDEKKPLLNAVISNAKKYYESKKKI